MSIKNVIQRLKLFLSRSCGKGKQSGTIKFFDRKKRFGFIISGKNEYFFHAAATQPNDFKALQDGVKVKFNVVMGKKGPQADNIDVIREQ